MRGCVLGFGGIGYGFGELGAFDQLAESLGHQAFAGGGRALDNVLQVIKKKFLHYPHIYRRDSVFCHVGHIMTLRHYCKQKVDHDARLCFSVITEEDGTMRTHLANALLKHLERSELTQAQLAELAKVSQSTIARMISSHRRPDVDTLKALCNCWDDSHVEIGLLCEHLRDEIDRAGKLQESVDVKPSGRAVTEIGQVDRDLDLLREEAKEHGDARELLHELAQIIRRHRHAQPAVLKVAEDRESYGTSTHKRK